MIIKRKCNALVRLFFAITFCLFCSGVNATNYYVSNGGNDSLDGMSPGTAWKTIAKVNSSSFLPGDSIKFNCGDRWFESMTINSSGTPNNYITITQYGSGAKPKLYGSIPVTSFETHPVYSNVYKINEHIEYDLYYGIPQSRSRASLYHIIGDTLIWSDGRLDRETEFSGLDENFKFLWQDNSVYFYYDGNIADIDTIEVTQKALGITLGGEYITIDGLDMKYWANRCIGVDNYPEVTKHGFQLRNCELAYTASKEEAVGYGIGIAYSDMLIENNYAHDNGRRNLSLNLVATTGNAVMRNVIVQNNELYNGYHTTGVDISFHSVEQQVKNIIIRNNKIWDPYGGNGFRSESIFLQNYEGVAPDENLDSIYIYNNLLLNITMDGVYLEHQGRHVYIINNTFTGSGARAFVFNATSNSHHTIMNNIFCNYAPEAMPAIDGATDGTSILDTCDYNLYFIDNNPYSSSIWYHMFDQKFYLNDGWSKIQELGYELHSPDPQEPHFNDSITDLRLRSSSPAIEAGKPISFITTDYFGNLRDSLNPDIGACEFVGQPDDGNDSGGDDGDDGGSGTIVPIQPVIEAHIYPNPAGNKIRVVLPYGTNGDCKLELFSLLGVKVFEESWSNDHRKLIDVSSVPRNMYIAKIQVDGVDCEAIRLLLQ